MTESPTPTEAEKVVAEPMGPHELAVLTKQVASGLISSGERRTLAGLLALIESQRATLERREGLLHSNGKPRFNEAMRRAEAAEARVTALEAEKAGKDALLRRMSDALLEVRPLGGSELFMRVGEEYYADPGACTAEIRRLRSDLHEARSALVKERRSRQALSRSSTEVKNDE